MNTLPPVKSGADDDDISALLFDSVTPGGSRTGAKSKSHKEAFALENFLLRGRSGKRSLGGCWAEDFAKSEVRNRFPRSTRPLKHICLLVSLP